MFIVPPFSILDTRQGYWQERKRSWLSLGIKSELGRDVKTLQTSSMQGYSGVTYDSETSIFDPVLCEFSYRAFCLDGGKIFDPFAGGSVRGIVAAKLGYNYTGIDLRQEQIDANEANAREVGVQPKWICDDSLNADKYIEDGTCDLIFSCPPYFDLEEYSQDDRDLSHMDWHSFCGKYERIIATAARKLKPNRFAVFVVGDVRDKKGFYRDFIGQTKSAFLKAGMQLYNDAVLVEAIGTAMMRCGTIFGKYRKLVKTHQNVLVFYNGDQKKIANEFPQLDCSKYEDVVQQDEK